MKTTQRISPAIPVLVLLVGAVFAAVLLSQGNRGQMQVPQDSPLAATGGEPSGRVLPFRTEAADDWSVHSLAVSPDGLTIATSYTNVEYTSVPGTWAITGTVNLWRVAGWQHLNSFVYHDNLDSIRFTPDGKSLVVATHETMEWVSLSDGTVTRKIMGTFRNVALSPDWSTIATMVSETQVLLLRAEDGSVIRPLVGAMGSDGLAFSPDGQLLAVAGCDESLPDPGNYLVQLWRVSDGTVVQTLVQEKAQFKWSGGLAFSPDGRLVAWGDWEEDVRLYTVSDGALLHTLEFTYVEDIVFSPDGQLIAASSAVDLAALWRISSGEQLAELVNERGIYGGGGKVFDVEFSPDGKVVYGGTADGTVRMWNVP